MEWVIRQHDEVLIVEDNPLLAWDVTDQLIDLGFDDVHLAPSLRVANDYLLSRPIRLAVLDVNLGNELVFPLAAELRDRGIPFIFCTARAVKDFPSEWASYPILPKPFNSKQFAQALADLAR